MKSHSVGAGGSGGGGGGGGGGGHPRRPGGRVPGDTLGRALRHHHHRGAGRQSHQVLLIGHMHPDAAVRRVARDPVRFAEVAVDTEIGLVTVTKVVAVHDCGLIIDKLTLESQINGGVIMGMGYALYEERVMDDLCGVVLNPNFETYKLPGIADVPEIDVVLINMPERGVIGIGEPATVPTAAAIANAVANALGVRISSLPITPAKVLAALGKVPAVTT